MHHGAHTRFALHLGLCVTDDEDVARVYGGKGELATVSVALDGLTVVEVPGYDRETDEAPGDRAADRAAIAATGADVLVFDDEDARGRSHRTWRLVSDRALAAVTVETVASLAPRDEDGEEEP